MKATIKPYMTNRTKSYSATKTKFISEFWNRFISKFEDSREYKTVKQLSDKCNTPSLECLITALRTSLEFQFSKSSSPNLAQVLVIVKAIRLKDILINGLDNNVVAKARRNPTNPKDRLAMISELLNSSTDLRYRFYLNEDTNVISSLTCLSGSETRFNKELNTLLNFIFDSFKKEATGHDQNHIFTPDN